MHSGSRHLFSLRLRRLSALGTRSEGRRHRESADVCFPVEVIPGPLAHQGNHQPIKYSPLPAYRHLLACTRWVGALDRPLHRASAGIQQHARCMWGVCETADHASPWRNAPLRRSATRTGSWRRPQPEAVDGRSVMMYGRMLVDMSQTTLNRIVDSQRIPESTHPCRDKYSWTRHRHRGQAGSIAPTRLRPDHPRIRYRPHLTIHNRSRRG